LEFPPNNQNDRPFSQKGTETQRTVTERTFHEQVNEMYLPEIVQHTNRKTGKMKVTKRKRKPRIKKVNLAHFSSFDLLNERTQPLSRFKGKPLNEGDMKVEEKDRSHLLDESET
jgi:hypothetical protein